MRVFKFALLGVVCLLAHAAHAAWPDRPIKLLVTTSPGGMTDSSARIVAKRLSEQLGQPVLVENKPGGSGVIAATAALAAPADGYTMMMDSATFVGNPALQALRYDPIRDFVPVSLVVTAPMILVVPMDSPIKSFSELVAAARKAPGTLSFASAGTGSATHLGFEQLEHESRIDLVHVPYKGGAPAIADIVAGRINCAFVMAATAQGLIKAGKLRAIAATSAERIVGMPDLPTLAESGMPGFQAREWTGIFVKSGTPADIVQALSNSLKKSVEDEDTRSQLQAIGTRPVGSNAAEFRKFLDQERDRWGPLIKSRNIKPQ